MHAASLSVTGVTWAPGKRAPLLLHETSFTVPAGEVLGIVGPNGAGKTTLLRLIYGCNRPLTGQVCIGGVNLATVSSRAAARKVAAVLQEQPSDFSLNVREIVALGRGPHRQGFSTLGAQDNAIIDAAIERLHLQRFAHRTLAALSGGERQRVMVARALVQEPQVLVLDEPTNHLDIRHQLEVLELIRELDLTIVTSLHDLNLTAGLCDQVLILEDGRTKGYGSPETVLTSSLVSSAFKVRALKEYLPQTGKAYFSFQLPDRANHSE